jgi:glyoxylase-like metal-dependent hydrolase (beta-lactamase superfamily II)
VAGPELHLFTSGTLGLGGFEVPVPFYLIRHPQGDVIVDGGNPLAVARDPHAHWGKLADIFEVHMTEQQHCVAQLRQHGFQPESISRVVQTHMHIDHTGALGHFPDAEIVVHASELESARGERPHARGYVSADYEQPGLAWSTYTGELDLFGDGSVRLLPTPGHSAGHVSLLLELGHTGPVLLTADAVDNRAQWEGRQPPRSLHDAEQAERSRERLRDLADEIEPLLVFGHDPENFSQLKRAPDCYD